VRKGYVWSTAAIAALVVYSPGSVAPPRGTPPRFDATIRGITLSTHLDGRDWAWDEVVPTIESLRALGADWIAIHPYAAIETDGRVRFHGFEPANPPPYIARPIREAHRLGLKILIKPHLAYWGTPFRWRGEIDFADERQWEQFWNDYERWIAMLAAGTTDADGFVVGTELIHSLGHEKEWRSVVAAVRRRTGVPLTYAANWNAFDQVPFWDALDAIGIQAYFPLTEETDAGEEEIRAGWRGWMTRLHAFSEKHRRPIVFTELGYNRSFAAAARPWDYHTDGDAARRLQELCMQTALQAIEDEPAVLGAFLWKWFPEPRPLGRNFQLATPGMKRIIRKAWRDEAPAGPE